MKVPNEEVNATRLQKLSAPVYSGAFARVRNLNRGEKKAQELGGKPETALANNAPAKTGDCARQWDRCVVPCARAPRCSRAARSLPHRRPWMEGAAPTIPGRRRFQAPRSPQQSSRAGRREPAS